MQPFLRKVATKTKVDASAKNGKQSAVQSQSSELNRRGNPNPPNQFTERNQAATKHGLFSRYIPQETLE